MDQLILLIIIRIIIVMTRSYKRNFFNVSQLIYIRYNIKEILHTSKKNEWKILVLLTKSLLIYC